MSLRRLLSVMFQFERFRLFSVLTGDLFTLNGKNFPFRRLSVSARLDVRTYRFPIRMKKVKPIQINSAKNEEDPDIEKWNYEEKDIAFMDNQIDVALAKTFQNHRPGHRVFVIQPRLRPYLEAKKLTTPELRLDEAVTLIKTLKDWSVVDKAIIMVPNYGRNSFFGKGQLENLKNLIYAKKEVTALFVSVNILKYNQQICLQEELGIPVFDRYGIVIQILREHANTKEARLQIQLAELPYLWSRFDGISKGSLIGFDDMLTTWRGKEFHRMMFRRKESKIKHEIENLKKHRTEIRKGRVKNQFPVVAVIGYTNSGKTSLIKALTGKENLEPKDELFATLDVTVHEGTLPSSMKVLYIDTIGFISDVPDSLSASFIATLEEIELADVILHIRDVSHPDTVAQNLKIIQVLQKLNIPEKLLNNMIVVGNKIDKVTDDNLKKFRDEDLVLISATEMIATDYLRERIEDVIINQTGRQVIVMKVRIAGDEYFWLHENCTVVDENSFLENPDYTLMKVIISNVDMERFKHIFIKNFNKERLKK